MTNQELSVILSRKTEDDTLIQQFLQTWHLVVQILAAFARALKLPIFVFLEDECIYQSPEDTMPLFCSAMLRNESTKVGCIRDGRRRASGDEPSIKGTNKQLCHAGLVNGRAVIRVPPLGDLVVLFGSRRSDASEVDSSRLESVVSGVGGDSELGVELKAAYHAQPKTDIAANEYDLIVAICATLERLLAGGVSVYWQTINMTHELSLSWLPLGMLLMEIEEEVEEVIESDTGKILPGLSNIRSSLRSAIAELRLGLYVCRNLLSHLSERRFKEAFAFKLRKVDLSKLIEEMVELHRRVAKRKGITIRMTEPLGAPEVIGVEEELRRALHNVLTNAIKYSYHSTAQSTREVRVWVKNPYDPGFRQKRFSIAIQNYGHGLTDPEKQHVGIPGFRGERARREVPIGSGLGLSEVKKIMKLHSGDMRFSSKNLYPDREGLPTSLNEVDLIFPLA